MKKAFFLIAGLTFLAPFTASADPSSIGTITMQMVGSNYIVDGDFGSGWKNDVAGDYDVSPGYVSTATQLATLEAFCVENAAMIVPRLLPVVG